VRLHRRGGHIQHLHHARPSGAQELLHMKIGK
jgi:hypothetical protein